MSQFISILTALITFLSVSSAYGFNALRGKEISKASPSAQKVAPQKRPQLNLMEKKFVTSNGRNANLTSSDVALVIPMGAIPPTNDAELVKEKILGQTMSSIFKSSLIKKSAIGKTVEQVKKSTEVNYRVVDPETKKVKHEVDFDLDAVNRIAVVKYQGYIDSKVIYKPNFEHTEYQVSKQMNDNTKISVSHNEVPWGTWQTFNLNYNW